MRWLLAGALAVAAISCNGDTTLGPTKTLDGTWVGAPPGFSVSFGLSQTDSTVAGVAVIATLGATNEFNVDGTLIGQTVALIGTAPGLVDWHFDGTLSTTSAVIQGQIDGSGFNKLQLSMKKKK